MTELDYSTELTEEDFDDYLSVCFAVSGGFSKGTANVSPGDVKKLHPLMKHYAKMKHPFTACVRDNRKRFGGKTEAYCAVLKDLIVGSTNWRGKGKKYVPRALSQEEFELEFSEFKIDWPEGFEYYLSELTEEEIQSMIDSIPDTETEDFAEGDVVWDYTNSFDKVRKEVQEQLNELNKSEEKDEDEPVSLGYNYWVEDINSSEALVCYEGKEYFVVPYSNKKSGVVISEEEDWKPVEKAWIETNFTQEPQLVTALYFDDPNETKALEEDGLIWKSIMREGEWAYSPSPIGPIKKPVKIVKNGSSDKSKNIISMEELKSNFEQQVVESVTVPLSHKDLTHENTGYVRKMRFSKDAKGRAILEAGLEITEPDIKEKILRGSIANTSAGVLWNHIKKRTGEKFNTVMGHLALTNHPWLDELASFSDLIDKDSVIMSFSEHELDTNVELITLSNEDVNTNMDIPRGGEEVSTDTETKEVVTVVDRTFFDEIGLAEDDIREIVASHAALKAEQRKNSIDAKGKDWQDAGKSPALVKAAKEILFADDDTVSINFSDEGVQKTLSLSEIVDRLVEASPSMDLSDKLNEEDAAGNAPDADASKENERANFSDDVLALATQIWMDENLSEEEALKEAVKRSKS